jgi:hypothetical protein
MAQKGRPTKYTTKHNEQAFKLCLLGATDLELADFFEVHVDTIYEWQDKHVSFSESLNKGKIQADAEIAHSFYNRAKGFEIESEKIFQFEGSVIRADTKTYYPPDPGAAMSWLKNRQGKKWRDKTEVESVNVNINTEPTAEEARKILQSIDNKI